MEDSWRAVERESEENSRFVVGFQGQPAIDIVSRLLGEPRDVPPPFPFPSNFSPFFFLFDLVSVSLSLSSCSNKQSQRDNGTIRVLLMILFNNAYRSSGIGDADSDLR